MHIQVYHAKLPITGYRFGKFAYITDMKTIDDSELDYLHNIDTLVVNALRFTPDHHAHHTVDEAVAFARKVGARRTFLVHVCHDVGLHQQVNSQLPEDIQLAYDGQVVDVEY